MNTTSETAAAGIGGSTLKQLLGTYVVAQVALMTAVQIITAIRGPKIDVVDGIILIPSWVLMMYFNTHYRVGLRQIRFGFVVVHAATFAIVNGSYHLAAFIRVLNADSAAGSIPLDPSWFGVLIAMCGFWSIGLVGHIGSAITRRGYEG